jgi:uncharacterized ferritin-like protein (DUF455 family)
MAGARILERILADEIRHVRYGANHFAALCQRCETDVETAWNLLVESHFGGTVKPPFNDSARAAAGLPRLRQGVLA